MRVGLKPKEVTALLRERGFKVTPQRLAVYNALAHTTEHPSAETLYQELLPDYPTMSLATVYKSLNILCAVGIVQELNVGEDSFRYDARVSPLHALWPGGRCKDPADHGFFGAGHARDRLSADRTAILFLWRVSTLPAGNAGAGSLNENNKISKKVYGNIP